MKRIVVNKNQELIDVSCVSTNNLIQVYKNDKLIGFVVKLYTDYVICKGVDLFDSFKFSTLSGLIECNPEFTFYMKD